MTKVTSIEDRFPGHVRTVSLVERVKHSIPIMMAIGVVAAGVTAVGYFLWQGHVYERGVLAGKEEVVYKIVSERDVRLHQAKEMSQRLGASYESVEDMLMAYPKEANVVLDMLKDSGVLNDISDECRERAFEYRTNPEYQ